MTKLTIVASIRAAEGKQDLVRSELEKLVEPTRAEDGCLRYDLHQDNKEPNQFVFLENWKSRADLDKHMETPHIAAFLKATKGSIDSFTMNDLTQLS